MIKNLNARVDWIDILKGFAIIAVVLGHIPCQNGSASFLYKLLYSFHMGLFFALSGYTAALSYTKTNKLFPFLKKRILTILIPYVAWCGLRSYFINGLDYSTISNFWTFLWVGSGSLWFMPALFVTQIVFALYMKLSQNSLLRRTVFFIIFALGMLCYHRFGCPFIVSHLPQQPCYLTPIFIYFWPFAMGAFIFLYHPIWEKLTASQLMTTICLLIYVPFCTNCAQLPLRIYCGILVILSGVFLIIKLLAYTPSQTNSFLSTHSKNPVLQQLSYIGKHTLGIYLLSDFLLPNNPFLPGYAGFPEFMIGTLFSIVVCYCCIVFEKLICLSTPLAAILYGKTIRKAPPAQSGC